MIRLIILIDNMFTIDIDVIKPNFDGGFYFRFRGYFIGDEMFNSLCDAVDVEFES